MSKGLQKFVFSVVLCLLSTFILYFAWNHIAPIYYTFLPPVFLHIPFWNIFCILLTTRAITQALFCVKDIEKEPGK